MATAIVVRGVLTITIRDIDIHRFARGAFCSASVVALLVVTGCGADKTEKKASPSYTRDVVFSQAYPRGRGDLDLFLISHTGRGLEQITYSPDDEVEPSWSPNGKSIAYTNITDTGEDSADEGNRSVWILDLDSSEKRQLTSSGLDAYGPSWSPDGTRITFVAKRAGNTDVYSIAPSGKKLKRLTDSKKDEDQPTWSPDGKQIAYTVWNSGGERPILLGKGKARKGEPEDQLDLYLMDSDGTDAWRLTKSAASENQPSWSPDGHSIAFSADRKATKEEVDRDGPGRRFDLRSIDVRSGKQSLLLDAGSYTAGLTWSSDGKSLIFGGPTLWLVELDSGKITAVVPDTEAEKVTPDWRR